MDERGDDRSTPGRNGPRRGCCSLWDTAQGGGERRGAVARGQLVTVTTATLPAPVVDLSFEARKVILRAPALLNV